MQKYLINKIILTSKEVEEILLEKFNNKYSEDKLTFIEFNIKNDKLISIKLSGVEELENNGKIPIEDRQEKVKEILAKYVTENENGN